MAQVTSERRYEVPLDGKLITGDDPTKIGPNFQQLTNLRYSGNHPKGIGGMTKVNSTIMDATYFKARSGIHYMKEREPDEDESGTVHESHVLVEAWNTGLTDKRILQNTHFPLAGGNFETTAVYAPNQDADVGRWALVPDGDVVYCNGKEACIWSGDEREVAGFINYDPGGTYKYDFTDRVTDRSQDTDKVAVISSRPGGLDSNVMLLMHMNNAYTDSSPTTAHTVSHGGTVAFDAADYVFGGYSMTFTTDGYLQIPDDADFDFSDGSFTIDLRLKVSSLSAENPIYYQATDANNYFKFYVGTSGALKVSIFFSGSEYFGGTSPTAFTTDSGVIAINTWYHVQLVENGSNWYIFVDGVLKAFQYDAARCANYTGNVYIGKDASHFLEGKIDELRVSDTARNESDFTIPTSAYSTSDGAAFLYVGVARPVDGFKFYVDTASTSAGTLTVSYWSGTAWTACSTLVDNTTGLGTSGWVTFLTTVASAKPKYIDGVQVYWYQVEISAVSSGTSIYYLTASCPFQSIKDLWSGDPQQIDSFLVRKEGGWNDFTLNVRENKYTVGDLGTVADVNGVNTYMVFGFYEPVSGIVFHIDGNNVNQTDNTSLTVQYWDGDTWHTVGTIDDGTSASGISFGQTGAVTWRRIPSGTEFKRTLNYDVSMYYYKFTFSKSLYNDDDTNGIALYYAYGIPRQRDLKQFSFPLLSNDRLFLCNENKTLYSAQDTSSVFNGEDSGEFIFGDNGYLTGGAWIYSQFGSSIYNVTLFFKRTETWALIGSNPDDWVKYRLSSIVGCPDPQTIRVVDLGVEAVQGLNRNVVIWRASNAIMISDGRTPIELSPDIRNVFDRRNTTDYVNNTVESTAFWDDNEKEYHWLYADGDNTTLNREMVYSFKYGKWFEIDRTTNKKLQIGIEVTGTGGVNYQYGFIDTGYALKLENGNSMDGEDITHTFQLGDIAIAGGNISVETKVAHTALISVAKNTTANSISVTHYGDGDATGTALTTMAQASTKRIVTNVYHGKLDRHIFHSWKFSVATDDETCGFEPLYFYCLYDLIGDHKRDRS